jgi:lysophospholipase L1-like esterase
MRDASSMHKSWLWLAMLAIAACSTEENPSTGAGGAPSGMGGGPSSSVGGAASNAAAGAPVSGGAAGSLSMDGGESDHAGLGGASGGGVASVGGAPSADASLGGASLGGASLGGASLGGASSGGASAGSSGAASGGTGGTSTGGSGAAGSSAGDSGGGKAFMPCPTSAGTPCAVLPLGDSITEGFGSSGAGYRVELFKQAVQNKKNLTFVGSLQNGPNTVQNATFPKRHEGHDGYTIDSGTGHSGISGSITDQAIANYHPNIVLLMIGTNDINGNIDVANAPTRLGNLIDDITTRAPSALVVVATIIPIANGTNQKVQTYNASLASVVSMRAAAGKHVALIDNYAAFSKDPNYATTLMFNYLHPNDAGYVVLGDSFYGAISTVLPPAT